MKLISVLLLTAHLGFAPLWMTDFNSAKEKASQEHKMVMLSFSGSDWCAPSVRMHKEIFDSKEFTSYAEQNLVLVNADFPRLKKNQLSKDQMHQNETLADHYNPEGKFPFTLLLDSDGKVLKSWEGCPNESPQKFVAEVNNSIHAFR